MKATLKGSGIEVIPENDAVMVDECFRLLPGLLLSRGITLKQKRGYKAGKLTATRNWCQLIDGDMYPRMCSPDSQGRGKTWKLIARFDASHPPLWPWDKPERCDCGKAQRMPTGGDIWGVTYENIREWRSLATLQEILDGLVNDLQASYDYSVRRYK